MTLSLRAAKNILHVGGIGLIPKAPGTWGSLAGLLSGALIVALFGGVWALLLCSLAAIAAGLLVHRQGTVLGPTAQDVLGDALWGTMMA